MKFHLVAPRLFVFLLVCACAATDNGSPPLAAPIALDAEPAPPAYVASDIMGASAARVDALLGAPTLTRQEGAGEYRRYSLTQCGLIIILYPDETGASRTAHIEATALTSGSEKPSVDACLAAG